MKGGKLLMAVQIYQLCAMYDVLGVTRLPLDWVIESHMGI